MKRTDQSQVVEWIKKHKQREGYQVIPSPKASTDNTGPDLVLEDRKGTPYYIEAIGFSVKQRGDRLVGTGQNQQDFWKAYAQACSRLKRVQKEYAVIALPMDYLSGWKQRIKQQFNETVWNEMGPRELQIWFVSKGKVIEKKWNESHSLEERV